MNRKIKSLDLEWLETNNTKTDIPVEELSTAFNYESVDQSLGYMSDELRLDNENIRTILLFIIKYATESRYYRRKHNASFVYSHRFWGASLCICNSSFLASTDSLRAFCRHTKLNYFYLRRCMIQFRSYCNKNKIK